MIVYDDSISYKILDSELKFYSDETIYGWNVVAEYNSSYYYLGSEVANIQTAVVLWEQINKRNLTLDELEKIMVDNNLIL